MLNLHEITTTKIRTSKTSYHYLSLSSFRRTHEPSGYHVRLTAGPGTVPHSLPLTPTLLLARAGTPPPLGDIWDGGEVREGYIGAKGWLRSHYPTYTTVFPPQDGGYSCTIETSAHDDLSETRGTSHMVLLSYVLKHSYRNHYFWGTNVRTVRDSWRSTGFPLAYDPRNNVIPRILQ